MPIGISDLAHSVRKNSASVAAPVQLGHAQQLIVAALGYKSLAAYQAAQVSALEPQDLGNVHHVVLDYDQLDQRASELGAAPTPSQLHELIDAAFKERASRTHIHASHADFDNYLREHVDQVVIEDDDVNSEMANANYDGIDEVYFDFEVESENVPVGSSLEIDLNGHVGLGIDTERPYAGHKVNVEGFLAVERLGSQCFGSVDCQVTKAELDTNWGMMTTTASHRRAAYRKPMPNCWASNCMRLATWPTWNQWSWTAVAVKWSTAISSTSRTTHRPR